MLPLFTFRLYIVFDLQLLVVYRLVHIYLGPVIVIFDKQLVLLRGYHRILFLLLDLQATASVLIEFTEDDLVQR